MGTSIIPLLDGLLYPSESDEPVHYFSVEWPQNEPLRSGEVTALLGLPGQTLVIKLDPAPFWELVTVWHPWHGPQELERTRA